MTIKTLVIGIILFLAGCTSGPRQLSYVEEMESKQWLNRLTSWYDVTNLKFKYASLNDAWAKGPDPKYYPFFVVAYIRLDFSGDAVLAWMRSDFKEQVDPSKFEDGLKIRSEEGREYLAFMKSQAAKWAENRLLWEEVHYSILAKGNELEARLKSHESDIAIQRELEEQNRLLRARQSTPPPLPNFGAPAPVFTGPNPHEAILRCRGRAVDFVTGRCM